MTTADLIAAALKNPNAEDITIFWDRQDANNEGPAWRTETESGALEFRGWSSNDAEGYHLGDYFQGGRYLGPDQDGIYPILIDA